MDRQIKPKIFQFDSENAAQKIYKHGDVILIIPNTINESEIFRSAELVKLNDLPLNVRIKRLRESLGISQRGLAKQAGISQGEISAIELGSSKPGVKIIKKLGDTLGVDFLFFAE